jgi:hypothetical protein
VDQEVEHLRLDRDRLPAALQLAAFHVQRAVGEREQHVEAPRPKTSSRVNQADLKRSSSGRQSLSAASAAWSGHRA